MTGRVVKLLREFLRRPPTKVDKRIWNNLDGPTRGELRATVERGMHVDPALRNEWREFRQKKRRNPGTKFVPPKEIHGSE
jgi:hypothetical protein